MTYKTELLKLGIGLIIIIILTILGIFFPFKESYNYTLYYNESAEYNVEDYQESKGISISPTKSSYKLNISFKNCTSIPCDCAKDGCMKACLRC